ncbi:cupin domain-containing protein [Paenarthrobacter nitroguajacolicus]|uniref:cupin domain-containing protein n=1 Tax=Paenarthrobacter nitroguajacolicus TaxID=211146 RepID=UPI00285A057E|nr:cupin domain-containing protein [Paenarthrobacter nitroguajacolicus]MDR6639492.1 putative cupin superfamily protein [Paenarthrobacter nitroguajacolicus]
MTEQTSAPTFALDVNRLTLQYEPVPLAAIAEGSPETGSYELAPYAGVSIGVWELTAGGMRDIEIDEVFLVTAGSAVMLVHHEEREDESIPLRSGTIVRLTAGMVTTWFVDEPLRKVYLIPR